MFESLRLAMFCGTVLVLAFIVLLALPQSKLREIVLPFVGWAVAALSVAYAASPLDVLPDFIPVIGWVDDLVALIVGIGSILTLVLVGKGQKQLR